MIVFKLTCCVPNNNNNCHQTGWTICATWTSSRCDATGHFIQRWVAATFTKRARFTLSRWETLLRGSTRINIWYGDSAPVSFGRAFSGWATLWNYLSFRSSYSVACSIVCGCPRHTPSSHPPSTISTTFLFFFVTADLADCWDDGTQKPRDCVYLCNPRNLHLFAFFPHCCGSCSCAENVVPWYNF